MTRRYFEEEMRYLHEAGKVFAENYPELGHYLNIDSLADRDPYVERLFEGFAFLTGRIREQLDDELPQYTESLFSLLFPHFLKPIPALTLLEFQPKYSDVQATTTLDKGIEVRSRKVGDEKIECRFMTTQEVRLHPLSVADVKLEWGSGGTTQVTLAFRMEGRSELQDLELNALRLHFVADPAVASLMHLFCTRHVAKMVVRPTTDGTSGQASEEGAVTLLGQRWVQPGGLTAEEALLPRTDTVFPGFRLLQEYMAYRRKFWCVDLLGLDQFRPAGSPEGFQVKIFFDRVYPEDKRFRTENVRLYCTPAVNLFPQDAEPIRVDHLSSEYRVVADTRYRKSMHVYNVETGVGVEDKTGNRHAYLPYYSFLHTTAKDLRYFTASSRAGADDHFETYISLNPDMERSGTDGGPPTLAKESLSLDLVCTNGSLPREKVRERMIDQLGPGISRVASPSNLTQPSLILYPPVKQQDNFFWKLISHWSLNFQTLADRDALAGLLSLYDWTMHDPANQRRIEGLEDVLMQPKEHVFRGAVVRGVELTLKVKEGYFADEGDLCLFGLVMSRFFSMYATINSFVHLTIEMVPSGKRYQWQPQSGAQPIL
jgi:type VI secretion system protein ImpG